ncbi:PaaI family thioesterase [Lewinella sp. IMCC34183]|uniref:PaaI family thioesterase n=1 Tax=Lewinella sp. IMCC34183 TaxID=2248762 RepID=UPI000E220222|nr:PaaI family thioesterase [Lewinella sp. IMCC34183]
MHDAIARLRSQIGQEATESPSPFMRWLRPVILSVEEGALAFRIRVREEMLNPGQTLHGGVSAAMIDDIIGATLFTLPDPVFYVSLNLSVDYLGPAMAGEDVIVRSHLTKRGRRHVLGTGEVWNTDESRVLVRGSANLIPRVAR